MFKSSDKNFLLLIVNDNFNVSNNSFYLRSKL